MITRKILIHCHQEAGGEQAPPTRQGTRGEIKPRCMPPPSCRTGGPGTRMHLLRSSLAGAAPRHAASRDGVPASRVVPPCAGH